MLPHDGSRRHDRFAGARRSLALLALSLFSVVTVSCGSSHTATPSHHPTPVVDGGAPDSGASPDGGAHAPLDVTVADLAAAGLSVFADANQTSPMLPPTTAVPVSPYRMLLDQANAMIAEADAHQGMLGSDLDALVVVAPDLPSASYFLAGYVSAAGTPGALLARRVMGTQDWVHAPTLIYPSLVFALFAADAARYANELAGTADAGSTGTAAQPLTLPSTPCSDARNFIDATINGFFDALGHLKAPPIPQASGFLGLFTSGLQAALDLAVGVVNGVIDFGRIVVVNGVKAAAQPLLDAIAQVAGPIGVAVQIVTTIRPWTIKMDAAPPQTSKGVDPGAGAPGNITATVSLPGGFDTWPPIIVDCMNVAGVTLPSLKPVGAPATWTLAQQPASLVVQNTAAETVLDENTSASVGYVTTTESTTNHRGPEYDGKVMAQIVIRRKEIAELQKTVADAIFAQIPSLIRPIVEAVLRPSVTKILGLPPSLLDTHGYQPLVVTYHECPPDQDCCPMGQTACNTECKDLSSDAANCGGCGIPCPSGQPCSGGVCVPPPPPTSTACPPPCAAGQVCSAGMCRTIVGSCYNSGPTAPTCTDEFDATAKRACAGQIFTWSDLPCPTSNRMGSCDEGDFIQRYYTDTDVPHGTCTADADCGGPEAIQCPNAPIVAIPYPCVGGLCDGRETPDVAKYICCFDCTVNPLNPYPAVCNLWTPN